SLRPRNSPLVPLFHRLQNFATSEINGSTIIRYSWIYRVLKKEAPVRRSASVGFLIRCFLALGFVASVAVFSAAQVSAAAQNPASNSVRHSLFALDEDLQALAKRVG